MKTIAAAFTFLLVPIVTSLALTPTLLLGGSAGVGSYSLSPTPNQPYMDAGIDGTFGWRKALGSRSYFSLASRDSIAGYLTTLRGSLDSEAIDGELGIPSGRNNMIFGAGFKSSVQNQSGVGSYILPYWSGEYRFRRNARGFQPSLTYGGRYVAQQFGGDNHFVETLGLKLDRSTTVRFDGHLGLDVAWELWPQQPILDSTGASTSGLRQDYLFNLSAGANGLAGFSLDWQAGVSAGFRYSTANQYLSAVPQLSSGSQTRFTQAGTSSVTWTPSRSFSLTLAAVIQNDAYLSRKALNASGLPTTANLDVFSAGGFATASWALSGNTYLVIRGNASRTFANDPSFPQWDYDVSGGVQYSF